jgi:hypothetical protein
MASLNDLSTSISGGNECPIGGKIIKEKLITEKSIMFVLNFMN